MEGEGLISFNPQIRTTIGYVSGSLNRRHYFKKLESTNPVHSDNAINIVWVHDFYYYHRQLIANASELILSNPSIKIYLVDLYGFGLSGGHRSHCEQFSIYRDSLLSLIKNEISGKELCLIGGQGVGAIAALDTVFDDHDNLVDGLILGNPIIDLQKLFRSDWKRLLLYFKSSTMGKVRIRSNLHLGELGLSDKITAVLESDPLSSMSLSLSMIRGILKSVSTIKDKAYFLDKPILFLAGKNGNIIKSQDVSIFAKMFPRNFTTYCEIPDVGHDLFLGDNFIKVRPAIDGWLSKFNLKGNIC